MPHDPIDPADLLAHQIAALRETGVVVPDGAGLAELESLVVSETEDEPSSFEKIVATTPNVPSLPVDRVVVLDRILAGWLGRCAGNGLGKPFESALWTPALIRDYLKTAGAWPLVDYVPVIDPMPSRFVLRQDCFRTTTRGNIDGVTRDDDLDYTLLNLLLLEQHGREFTTEQVGSMWLSLLPFGKTFTAEAAAYRNLATGVAAPRTATVLNPYREWVGALIRADIFGLVSPGRPAEAARMAFLDARLSHVRNGIYGSMWAAAAVAAAFGAATPREVVTRALAVVPRRSRLHKALAHVLDLHAAGAGWEAAIDWIHRMDYYYVHTINNAAIIAAALLWSDGAFTTAVGLAVSSAYDTDSNGATVGAIAGVLAGTGGIPAHWTEPLHDRFTSALSGHATSSIAELAARTYALTG
ncbi:ADP-ribosylglycohydrolase family protein [Actinoplanes sp. CA-142083]|uniref:ADP-ribosylglycohydrolase family protein n=1 Tax=Actinoplanes sp. CA-142083 TaxID=3239903 RepID=UPI003D9363EE